MTLSGKVCDLMGCPTLPRKTEMEGGTREVHRDRWRETEAKRRNPRVEIITLYQNTGKEIGKEKYSVLKDGEKENKLRMVYWVLP